MRVPDQPLLFLNIAHAYDHFFMLIFPTAVLALHRSWGIPYGEALALGTASFVAFGAGSLPAGWLGDRWSRAHMMSIFFIGLGISAILTGLAQGPWTLAAALGLLGLFASIYHPVATALVVQQTQGSGRALGVNGVFGNMGVAAAALVTGLLAGALGWRAAFILPGLVALATGVLFSLRIVPQIGEPPAKAADDGAARPPAHAQLRVFAVVATTALLGGLIFHGTTIALPKIFEQRLAGLTESLASIGLLVSLVFAFAAFAQIAVGHLLDRFGKAAPADDRGAPGALPLGCKPALGARRAPGGTAAHAAGVRRDPDQRLADRPLRGAPLARQDLRGQLPRGTGRERAGGAADCLHLREQRRLHAALPDAGRHGAPGGAVRSPPAAVAPPAAGTDAPRDRSAQDQGSQRGVHAM
jgi:MFS family permease